MCFDLNSWHSSVVVVWYILPFEHLLQAVCSNVFINFGNIKRFKLKLCAAQKESAAILKWCWKAEPYRNKGNSRQGKQKQPSSSEALTYISKLKTTTEKRTSSSKTQELIKNVAGGFPGRVSFPTEIKAIKD